MRLWLFPFCDITIKILYGYCFEIFFFFIKTFGFIPFILIVLSQKRVSFRCLTIVQDIEVLLKVLVPVQGRLTGSWNWHSWFCLFKFTCPLLNQFCFIIKKLTLEATIRKYYLSLWFNQRLGLKHVHTLVHQVCNYEWRAARHTSITVHKNFSSGAKGFFDELIWRQKIHVDVLPWYI